MTRSGGTEQVPPITSDVDEDGHPAISLHPWKVHELDASGHHSFVSSIKIVNSEEEADATARLVSYRRFLDVSVGLGKQDTTLGAWWPYDHPPFRPPLVRDRRRVLYQLETEDFYEEHDGGIIFVYDDGDEIDE